MSSQIKSALTTIAAWSPTYDSDVTVTAYGINQVYTEHGKPFRKLTVVPGPNPTNTFVGLGKTLRIDWEVHDIFYFKPVGYADGKKTADEALVDYIVSYIEAARKGYALTSQTVLTGLDCVTGVYQWGNDQWFGVDCELTITETYGGA